MCFPKQSVVTVDVDGTLLVDGRVNAKLVAWLKDRKAEGFELILWSAAGRQHAENAANFAGIAALFSAIISKPGFTVDDRGWDWTRTTKVIDPKDFLK